MMRWSSILMLIILGIAASCSGRSDDQREVLSGLLGREIAIPDELSAIIQGVVTPSDMSDADFKIITYIDSAGCVPCRMKLSFWNDVIDEFKATDDDINVEFLMILNTRLSAEMSRLIDEEKFMHQVCFDPEGLFEAANPLPRPDPYHTFLLNADNEIVAVGNPVANPKVMDIYRKIISPEPTHINLLCRRPVATLGFISPADTVVRRFQLRNTTDSTLTIQALIPSCGCVEAEAEAEVINPDEVVMVTVTYLSDTIVGPVRRHVDIFYHEKDNPERLTLHGFITNQPIH